MTKLYAQPYDMMANGFYFETEAEYLDNVATLKNSSGQPVEEFEIQFIDGEAIDAQLFEALRVNQCNFGQFLDAVAEWDVAAKVKVIIAVGEVGHSFDLAIDDPEKFEVDLYECESLRDLATQFVDDGLFGNIPASIQNYLDYDAIARDLAFDYAEILIDGANYIYRCD